METLERVFEQQVAPGEGAWLTLPAEVPRWQFLCWLTEQKGFLLHGSGDPNITCFEPRTPDDRSSEDFSRKTAVFATDDGIWPIFYAVLDRTRFPLRMLNGALRFRTASGDFSEMHYFFSVTASALERFPWREGVIYVLPRASFVQQAPFVMKGHEVLGPQWARFTPVRPLAKLRVLPEDFPFLFQVRAHDDTLIAARAAQDPEGFPWLA